MIEEIIFNYYMDISYKVPPYFQNMSFVKDSLYNTNVFAFQFIDYMQNMMVQYRFEKNDLREYLLMRCQPINSSLEVTFTDFLGARSQTPICLGEDQIEQWKISGLYSFGDLYYDVFCEEKGEEGSMGGEDETNAKVIDKEKEEESVENSNEQEDEER